MSEKTQGSQLVDDYISQFPQEIQQRLMEVRKTIRETVPQAEEKISFKMPAFSLHGNLVYYAAFKNHIGFYPTGSGIKAFEHRFADYKYSKGAVQFSHKQPIPHDLIAEITKFRVEENEMNASLKRKK